MKRAVAQLYANVLRFFIRAQDWYEEGRLLHILHSLTRPVEIRFADIIEDVKKCTDIVDSLAITCAQAEQRDIHSKVQEVLQRQKSSENAVLEIRQMMISKSKNDKSCVPSAESPWKRIKPSTRAHTWTQISDCPNFNYQSLWRSSLELAD